MCLLANMENMIYSHWAQTIKKVVKAKIRILLVGNNP